MSGPCQTAAMDEPNTKPHQEPASTGHGVWHQGQTATGRAEQHRAPGWLRPSVGEHRLPVAAAILTAAGLQLLLSQRFTFFRPHWVLPAPALALLAPLTVLTPLRLTRPTPHGSTLSSPPTSLLAVHTGLRSTLPCSTPTLARPAARPAQFLCRDRQAAHIGRAGAGAVCAPGEPARGGKNCGFRPQDRRLAG